MADKTPRDDKEQFTKKPEATENAPKTGDYRQTDKALEIYVKQSKDGQGRWVSTTEYAENAMFQSDYTRKMQALKESASFLAPAAEGGAPARPRLGLRPEQNREDVSVGVTRSGNVSVEQPAGGTPSGQAPTLRPQREDETDEEYEAVKRIISKGRELDDLVIKARQQVEAASREHQNLRAQRELDQDIQRLYAKFDNFNEDRVQEVFATLDVEEQNRIQRLAQKDYAAALKEVYLEYVRPQETITTAATQIGVQPPEQTTPFSESGSQEPRDFSETPRVPRDIDVNDRQTLTSLWQGMKKAGIVQTKKVGEK